jgi:two-component system response regulator QseB
LAAGLRQLGQVVDWFTTGAQADAALAAAPFDAVVLDLGLPGGDGMHWLGRWRNRGLKLPVLILTARDAVDQRIAGLEWQHGALEYDPAAKRVRWKGVLVELTGRELALLEALLADPQRVLSKPYLQEKLYDWSGGEPESNTLEVHIHRLRRKIDPSIVRTVRGVGYALGSGEVKP